MDNYTKELENNLLEMVKQKEQADKQLLRIEIITGILCLVPLLFSAIVIPFFIESGAIEEWLGALIIGLSLLPLVIAIPFMIKIEQTAGYYECQHCGHKHVPTYKAVLMAMHVGRTRYLKCPNCGKKSWQKKVISKD